MKILVKKGFKKTDFFVLAKIVRDFLVKIIGLKKIRYINVWSKQFLAKKIWSKKLW